MGIISRRLADRIRTAPWSLGSLARLCKNSVLALPNDLHDARALVREGYDPLRAAYLAAQNYVAAFAESASEFEEFDPYSELAGPASDEYMPHGPPISPLTTSYFTSWAFFDLRFGPDRETIGSCLLDVADLLKLDEEMFETVRRFQATRMGIYEHCGGRGGRVVLRELVTGDEFACCAGSQYRGRKGELWYVRLCPPIQERCDYHLAVTTPYVLLAPSKAQWEAYLKRSIRRAGQDDPRKALHTFLKHGKSPDFWNEFVFLAYHHHQFTAVYLSGLPGKEILRAEYGRKGR
jgi:hypothetical protein